MKRWLFLIRDRQTDHFGPILTVSHPHEALRMVPELLQADSMVSRYPSDYELVQIGTVEGPGLELVSDVRVLGSMNALAKLAAAAAAREAEQPNMEGV